MQGMGKELITLSKESVKTQCYEFECFEDNYALTFNTEKFNTEGTWFLQSFKTQHPPTQTGLELK